MSDTIPFIKQVKKIKGHLSFVYSILLLKDGRLASCSDDETIKIYRKITFECDISLNGHEGYIWYISQLENGNLISCSGDTTIKIWTVSENDGVCIATLKGHMKSVTKVIPISTNLIASGSDDKTIKIWNSLFPFSCLFTFDAHTYCISSILKIRNKKILISGDFRPGVLIFWNLEQFTMTCTLNKISCWGPNSLAEFQNNKLLVGGKNVINIVNYETKQIETTIFDFKLHCVYTFLILKDGSFLTGGYKLIRYWDGYSYSCKAKKAAHEDYIIKIIQGDDEYTLFSCSYENEIYKWKI